MRYVFSKVGAIAACTVLVAAVPQRHAQLRLEEVGSDSTAFDVTSTLIIGPTEVLLWDTQYHVADAKRLTDRIAATGKHLKAIIISHPDHDHYMGAAVIVQRFPGTPVYMTTAAIADFNKSAPQSFAGEKARRPADTPDSLVTPKPLPSNHLTVDGEAVELIPDLTGDVLAPTNSILWIPSLRTVLAADVVFNGVHPWLGASDEASRARWHTSLTKIADLHPTAVVSGHKRDINSPDSPDVLGFMHQYLTDFDAFRKSSTTPQQLLGSMKDKYPDLAVLGLLGYSAQVAFPRKAP